MRGPRPRIAVALLAALLAAVALSACGSDNKKSSTETTTTAAHGAAALPKKTSATLVLDFLPNGVHAGIYRALAAGYYKANNVDLKVIQPTSTADTLKLIDAGKADFGIADGIDVANQIDQGRDAKGIMALVQRPLGGIITLKKSNITSPKQLEGQDVGITGVPSDTAILNTVVAHGGGDPAKVKKITIGFNGVQNLENEKVKGFVGFYPADGVQVQQNGNPTNVFKFDENGGPRYPGLVVFSTQARIAKDAALMKAFVDATVKGYDDTMKNPTQSLNDLLAANPTLKRSLTAAQLKAYEPLFKAGAKRYGELSAANVQALSDYLVKAKLIKKAISPDRYGTNQFLPSSG